VTAPAAARPAAGAAPYARPRGGERGAVVVGVGDLNFADAGAPARRAS
jgi:hypothetical protein